ncbi:hypothetical protein [Albibacterium indicum]|uniref:hypothetical protein n=1 Tax=Albibacterium indicum TaxID=2292082 RepID=UPI000E500DCD|nr:hypothetical protein [Pedobacter indicus]
MIRSLSFIFSFLFACTSASVFSQVRLNAHNSAWISNYSYQGSVTDAAFRTEFHFGNKRINYPNWSLYVRLAEPMRNSEGKVFDPSRMKIRIIDPTSPTPALQEIGTNSVQIPLGLSNIPVISKAQVPLATNSDYQYWLFSYDIFIDGGAYLDALKSWQNYNIGLIFTLVNAGGQILAESTARATFQIYPQDQLPVEPTYAIQINGQARDGVLEFRNVIDYVNGVSQTYPGGLAITSTTPYTVQVRALSPNLTSADNLLPVNTVSLSITEGSGSVGGTIVLSENLQTVFNGINSTSQARTFDIRYFTKPNDERMLRVKPDSYQTTLMYTLIPQ